MHGENSRGVPNARKFLATGSAGFVTSQESHATGPRNLGPDAPEIWPYHNQFLNSFNNP